MAISEFETKRCEKAKEKFMAKRRPPAHIRSKLDLGFRIENLSVEIFEVRPRWDKPSEKTESPVAKATYVKNQKLWEVYWQRADLKWHAYTPAPTVRMLEEFLEIVDKDQYACFFG